MATTNHTRIALKCNECGKVWRVSPNATGPMCPKCGGADWDVKEPS